MLYPENFLIRNIFPVWILRNDDLSNWSEPITLHVVAFCQKEGARSKTVNQKMYTNTGSGWQFMCVTKQTRSAYIISFLHS